MRPQLRELLGSTFDPVFPTPAVLSAVCAALGIALTMDSVRAEASARPFAAPSLVTSSISSYVGTHNPPICSSPECVQRKLTAQATVRLRGEFGRFTGMVACWGPDSIAGFSPDPDWADDVPAVPVGWSQVERVDRRVSNAGRGAMFGGFVGVLMGALIAAVGSSVASSSVLGGSSGESYTTETVAIVAASGLLGAITGAAIGSTSSRWVLVYQRPLGSADAPR